MAGNGASRPMWADSIATAPAGTSHDFDGGFPPVVDAKPGLGGSGLSRLCRRYRRAKLGRGGAFKRKRYGAAIAACGRLACARSARVGYLFSGIK